MNILFISLRIYVFNRINICQDKRILLMFIPASYKFRDLFQALSNAMFHIVMRILKFYSQ